VVNVLLDVIGRTPEMFIAYLKHYKATWGEEATQVRQ
jgi:hypothetical protein